MTLAEYMDPKRFPESTQRGLTPDKQMMIDAINLRAVHEAEEEGKPISPDEMAVVKELKEKAAARDQVMKEWKSTSAK